MHITLATHADVPALCALLDLLFTQEADFRPDREAQARGLAAIIGDPGVGHILVARRAGPPAGEVLGMVSLLYTVSTALGGRAAWLEDMVVAPASRGEGVGSRLLARAVEHARGQGCLRLTLLTDADNQAAQRFYRRHGFAGSAMLPLRLVLNG